MRKALIIAAFTACGAAPAGAEIATTNCLIAPERTVDLAGRATGLISAVYVDVGETVREGQLLAQLDAAEEQAALALAEFNAADDSAVAAAKRQAAIAKDDLDRARELRRRGVLSAEGLNEREAEYAARLTEQERAEAALARAQLQLAQAAARAALKEVRAPTDGVVTQRFLEPGEFLNESAALLRLARLDRLKVEALADQSRYADIKAAVRLRIEPEIGPATEHAVKDAVIDPLIDPASGTFRIAAEISNEAGAIVAGQRCRIVFQ